MTLPTWITAARLCLSLLIAVPYLILDRPMADFTALALFVVASVCDFLDGFLARRLKKESKLGRMLDPVADKKLILIALLVASVFSGLGEIVIVPASLIVFREVFITGLREHLGGGSKALATTSLAKWKTAAQMSAVALVLLAGGMDEMIAAARPFGGMPVAGEDASSSEWGWTAAALLWAAAVLTLASGVDYFIKALPHFRNAETDD